MRPHSVRSVLATTAVVAVATLVTACASSPQTDETPDAPTVVSAGIATKFFEIAYEQADSALQPVDFSLFDGAGPAYEALAAQSLDVAFGADISAITSQSNGAELTVIGVAKPNPDWLRLIVPEGSSATSLADLTGQSIAVVRGSAAHRFIVGEIEAAGFDLGDFELQFLSTADAQAAFLSGSVDAWAAWEPNAAQVELENGAQLLQTATEATAGNIYITVHNAVLEQEDRSAAVGAFYADFVRAVNETKADLSSWGETLAQELGLAEPVALQLAQNYTFTFVPVDAQAAEDYAATAAVLSELGVIGALPDESTAFDDRFNDLLHEANGD